MQVESFTQRDQKDTWSYHLSVTDNAYEEATRYAERPSFVLSVSVLFPRKDLPTIVDRLRRNNEKRLRPKRRSRS